MMEGFVTRRLAIRRWLCGVFCETFFIYAFSLFVQLLQESGKREGIAVCVSYTRLGYGESSFQVP